MPQKKKKVWMQTGLLECGAGGGTDEGAAEMEFVRNEGGWLRTGTSYASNTVIKNN